ncbi:RagB/SusD family nutrient uptake outer membrane protein [Mangrovibacterium diazotrophicum]|uniref:Putative outer membrane starch-binding protein n=1 Tax=Mangrovibacterium diazotrophicum TaxID=1261403 RepID=A0A419VYK4_9BACT|nr:RagB/SusD family nutrient uptake outer membrane protein [Mangrovibacterium diazotrophicum]RKD88292.1 putative outer membrane starch-binding protein [Mangrovibacterium diazotrophicum]
MKNNILIYFLAILFSTVACTDLEENPIGALSPESYFQTEQQLEEAVLGIYYYMAYEGMYGRKLYLTINLLDDVSDIGNTGTKSYRVVMNTFNVDANNTLVAYDWLYTYKCISAANSAISGYDKIEITDQDFADQLLAEAKVTRAMLYFNLVRLFGDVPFIDSFVTDPESVASVSRTSVDEIYAQLIEDCEFGIEHLPDMYSSGAIRCRPTKGAAKTLLASMYLTMGDYTNAAKYAKEVISEKADYDYELLTDYSQLWYADNGDTKEHIWTVDFLAGTSWDYISTIVMPMNTDAAGWSVMVPADGLYDLYDDADIRKAETFLSEIEVGGEMTPYTSWRIPRRHYAKFSHPAVGAGSDGSNSGYNYPLFRFSEVYLIAAEALAEVNGGPTTEAYAYLNAVRSRAQIADLEAGLSKDDFIDAVLNERMLEFPCEGKRWFDIVRRQLGSEVYSGDDALEQHDFDPSKHYLLPLPQSELNQNDNLTQNPGY